MSTATFTCPRCGRTSHNPHDVEAAYCGACHWWTGDKFLGSIPPPTSDADRASNDAGHAANVAYLTVLRDAGYGRDRGAWPSSQVPALVMRRATKAGERARANVLGPP